MIRMKLNWIKYDYDLIRDNFHVIRVFIDGL